ncbi:MAG: ATP-binding protein [Anaerolinea sp.]|nr:ATP-binding protein [Anaerolinea sp.]
MTATRRSNDATSPKATRTSSSTEPADLAGDLCPICHGQGFVVLDLPIGHPDFGRAQPCRCRQAEIALRRQVELTKVSNLDQLRHMTFETFRADGVGLNEEQRQNLRRAFDKARMFAARPEGWLLLTGTYGCGKTHLAVAIAHEVLRRGQSALFVVTPDLLDHLRAAFGPSSETSFDERFETVRQTPLLILDDFGAQSATPWAKEKLFQLLNHRYTARLPTVITTNLRLNEIEARLRSRLADPDLSTVAPITAPDFRSSGDSSGQELSTLALHKDQTFESFDLRREELPVDAAKSLAEARAHAEAFTANPQGWLVLTGPYGSGKTHLAAAIANRRLQEQHERTMFVVVPDLLDYLRAAFSPNSAAPLDIRFEEVRRAPLLVLDDLGTESATPWAREKLFQLLNYRYAARLPTVITSSTPVEEQDPRLASRMLDTSRCTVVSILAPSYRGSKTQRAQKRRGR